MAAGRKTGGRQKGTPNKLSGTAKENIQAVFTRLGGYDKMTAWANENLTEFYKIYARLLPIETEITGKDGGPLEITRIERVIVDPKK